MKNTLLKFPMYLHLLTFLFVTLDLSYLAPVPLSSGWCTTGGTRTTVW
jgi:hypothetical protein